MTGRGVRHGVGDVLGLRHGATGDGRGVVERAGHLEAEPESGQRIEVLDREEPGARLQAEGDGR